MKHLVTLKNGCQVFLAINLDGIGLAQHENNFSKLSMHKTPTFLFYGCLMKKMYSSSSSAKEFLKQIFKESHNLITKHCQNTLFFREPLPKM